MINNAIFHQLQDQLSVNDPEKARLLTRRMKNKVAATKCRNKKKEKTKQIIAQTEALEACNYQLRQMVAKLEVEKRHLVMLLRMRSGGVESVGDDRDFDKKVLIQTA